MLKGSIVWTRYMRGEEVWTVDRGVAKRAGRWQFMCASAGDVAYILIEQQGTRSDVCQV